MSNDFERVGVEARVEGWQEFLKIIKKIERSLGGLQKEEEKTEKVSQSLADQIEEFGDRTQGSFLKLSAAGALIGGTFVKLASDAAPLAGIGQSFEAMASGVGLGLDELRDAAAGTVSDFELMRQANVALTGAGEQLGSQFGQMLPRLLEIARASARATGQDVGFLFQSLVTGIKRTSPMLIDNTGLQLKLGEANERMAEQVGKSVEELSGEEKQIALLSATVEAGGKIIDQFGGTQVGAAEKSASFQAELKNLKDSVGLLLVPAFGEAVSVAGDFIGMLNDAPDPVKRTVVELLGGVGAIASFAGAAGLAIPKIIGLVNAIKQLQLVQAIGLGPLGIGAAAIGAIATAAIYLNNLEEAHKEEAAAILESSQSYDEYIDRLEDAELGSYALSEGLYEVAKGAGAAADGIDALQLQEAQDEMEGFLDRIFTGVRDVQDLDAQLNLLNEALGNQIDSFDEHQLIVLEDEQAMRNLFVEMGVGIQRSDELARSVNETAAVERRRRQGLESLEQVERRREEVGRDSIQTTEELADNLSNLLTVTERTAESYEKMSDIMEIYGKRVARVKELQSALVQVYEQFTGTLATSILEIRDLDQNMVDATQNYGDALADLDAQAAESYGNIRRKYEESLPDATTVQERMGMQSDAWDEWALRLQDIIQNGVASPWFQVLQEMGHTKPPDVGIQEWAEGLKEAFYEGDLPGLINEDAQAWQEHAQKVKAAQDEEAAAVTAATRKKRKELREAYEEQQRLAQEAREQAVLEMSLQLAEESGLLQQWAQQRFGAYSGVADSAQEVAALIESGMLGVDETLAGIIEGNATGLLTVLDSTAGMAQTNQETMGQVYDQAIAAADQVQSAAEQLSGADQRIQQMEGVIAMFPPEDQDAVRTGLAEVGTGIDELKQQTDADPFAGLMESFTGAKDTMVTDAETLKKDIVAEIEQMSEDARESLNQILEVWSGNSVVPDMITAAEGLGEDWSEIVSNMLARWESASRDIEAVWDETTAAIDGATEDLFTGFEELEEWQKTVYEGFKDIKKIADELLKVIWALQKAFEDLEVPEEFEGESPPPVATWFEYTAQAVLDLEKSLEDLLDLGSGISRIGGVFGRIFESRTLDPLQDQIRSIDEELERLYDKDVLQPDDSLRILALEAERWKLAEKYAEQQARILELQRQQQQLQFLEQQARLLELIEEHELDAGAILGGLELGLDADVGDLMDAMAAAMQAIIGAAEDELGISSPSRVFMEMMTQAMRGAEIGVQKSAARPVQAAQKALIAPMVATPITQMGRVSSMTQTSNTFNFGGNTIADQMTAAAFEANVLRVVRNELRN